MDGEAEEWFIYGNDFSFPMSFLINKYLNMLYVINIKEEIMKLIK